MTALPAGSTNEAPDVELADENPSYNRLWTSWTTEDGAPSQLSSLTVNNPHTVGVKVRNGRFLVHLGTGDQTSLPNSVFDQRPLYVVTWVVNANGVFRLPPQALDKVPHAVTAERAKSFEVTGTLKVDQIEPNIGDKVEVVGDLNIQGTLHTDSLQTRVGERFDLYSADARPNIGLELHSKPGGVAYIDFRSSSTLDYDSRIINQTAGELEFKSNVNGEYRKTNLVAKINNFDFEVFLTNGICTQKCSEKGKKCLAALGGQTYGIGSHSGYHCDSDRIYIYCVCF